MRYSRRDVIATLGATAGLAGFMARAPRALGQTQTMPARTDPRTVISTPPRDFTPGAQPVPYPDPDISTMDPAFNALRVGNTPIQRLWTGAYWAEGPAWCSQGGIWCGATSRTTGRCAISMR